MLISTFNHKCLKLQYLMTVSKIMGYLTRCWSFGVFKHGQSCGVFAHPNTKTFIGLIVQLVHWFKIYLQTQLNILKFVQPDLQKKQYIYHVWEFKTTITFHSYSPLMGVHCIHVLHTDFTFQSFDLEQNSHLFAIVCEICVLIQNVATAVSGNILEIPLIAQVLLS